MGWREIQASCHGIGHHLQPAIQISGKAWIHHNDELCAYDGQCQQQQHTYNSTWVTMPAVGNLLFGTRCSHVMHAAYNSFGSDQGIVIYVFSLYLI